MAKSKLFTDAQLRKMGGKPYQAPRPVGRIVRVPVRSMSPEAYMKVLVRAAKQYGPIAERLVAEVQERLAWRARYGGRFGRDGKVSIEDIDALLAETSSEIREELTALLDEFESKYHAYSIIAFKKGNPIS